MPDSAIVHIIDDDAGERRALCSAVEALGVHTLSYPSADEFFSAFSPETPGCLIAEVQMSGIRGLDLMQSIQRHGWNLPVILVSAYASIPMAVQALQAGAVTFLEKPCGNTELWNAVRAALERDAEQRQRQARLGDITARLQRLTPQEGSVLAMIARGVQNKAIAARQNVTVRTIEARRRRVFLKMGARNLAELIHLAVEIGLYPSARDVQPPSGRRPVNAMGPTIFG